MSEDKTLRREGYAPSNLVVGQRGARTRQKIITETLRLFESQGFHATSVDGIAKAAGTSRSTLYQYFESKEQIFVELLEECGSALIRVARRIGPLGPTRLGFDNLHWWLGEWAWAYDKYATMFVQWANVDTPGTAIRPLVNGFVRSYDARIAERLASSGIQGMDPLDAATAMSSLVHRFNYFRHMDFVPSRTGEELLDGLAVSVQLMLFPDTPADVLTTVLQTSGRKARPTQPLPMFATGRPAGPVPEWENRLDGLRPRAAATVRQIIDAGATLFADRGYHGTGVDDLVAQAGLARGTFYKYFDEKLDLLLQLTYECAEEMKPLVQRFALIDPADDGEGGLRSWLTDYLPFHTRYFGVLRAWQEGTSNDPRLLATARRMSAAMLGAALKVLGRVERSYPLDLEVAATVLGAILERMPEALHQQEPERTPAQIAEPMAAVIGRGLLNGGTAA
jgi:AcrR family transcriptional regulator